MRHSHALLPLFATCLGMHGCIEPLGCAELLQCTLPGDTADADAQEASPQDAGVTPEAGLLTEAGLPVELTTVEQATDAAGSPATVYSVDTWETASSGSAALSKTAGEAGASSAAVEEGMASEAGAATSPTTPDGSSPVCGDDEWESSSEECDDGNSSAFDGCDRDCKLELLGVGLSDRVCSAPSPQQSCGNDSEKAHYCYGEHTAVRDVAGRACTTCYGACTDTLTAICGGRVSAFAVLRSSPDCDDYFVYQGEGECSGRGGTFQLEPGVAIRYCEAGGQWLYLDTFL